MKLITFRVKNSLHVGCVVGDRVVDLTACDARRFATMTALLDGGAKTLAVAAKFARDTEATLALSELALWAPVPRPGKYLALGLNYKKHAQEAASKGVRLSRHQVWFNKQITCVNGPYAPIHLPRVSDKLDYEAELALVIGRRGRHARGQDALDMIAGYTIANDVSVRDWQMRSQTWTMGKSFDTHGPLGPWLITADEMPGADACDIRCYVNGALRQSANTSDMIYSFADMIEHLSAAFTLEPGDVIATGTPAGIGSAMEPPRYLKVGDTVRIEVDGIGHIENQVIAEP